MNAVRWLALVAIVAFVGVLVWITRPPAIDHGTGMIAAEDAPPVRRPVNSICPIMARPAEPGFTVEHKGELIALCCQPCVDMFPLDPEMYMASLERDLK